MLCHENRCCHLKHLHCHLYAARNIGRCLAFIECTSINNTAAMIEETKPDHDIVLRITNGVVSTDFPCTKQLLASNSEYFAGLFRWHEKVPESNTATLLECDANDFKNHLLPFLNGKEAPVTEENLRFLVHWSDYLCMQAALSKCDEFIESRLHSISHGGFFKYSKKIEMACLALYFEGLDKSREFASTFLMQKMVYGDQVTLLPILPEDFLYQLGRTGIRSHHELIVAKCYANWLMDLCRLDRILDYLQVIGYNGIVGFFDVQVAEEIIIWLNLGLSEANKITSFRDERITKKTLCNYLGSRIEAVHSRKRKRRECATR